MKYKTIAIVAGMFLAAPAFAADEVSAPANDQPQAAAPATPTKTESGTAGTIARSAITTGVENREPVDSINKLSTDSHKVYYFTELKDMEGQQVTHRWEYNGKVMAEVPFQVGGSRWRVFSSKQLDGIWQGEWKVSVVDANGGTLGVNTFTYEAETPAAKAEEKAAPATTPAQ